MIFEMGAKLDEDSLNIQGSKANKANNEKQENKIISKNEHQLVFTFEKRNGKPVTLVGRFYLEDKEKKKVLKQLKSKLACGGTVNEQWLELQGDVKEKIKEILLKDGWKFKNKNK